MKHFLIIITLLLFLILLGATGCSCIAGKYYGVSGDNDILEVTDHYLFATINAKAVVHFAVRNISEQRITRAVIEINYYDEDENLLGSDTVTLSDLRPSDKTDLIRVTSSLNRLEVEGYGFTISAELYVEE